MKSVYFSALVFLISYSSSAFSQVNIKRDACLKEAETKGLYTSGSRNPGKFNQMMAPQRQEFMKECMARR